MKAFITGGTGFIGQALIKRLLSDGWQVTALARSQKKAEASELKGVVWVFGDICDESWHHQVVGHRVFVHLVGVHGHQRISYRERVTVELGGTQNAVMAAKLARVNHFIHIGTAFDQMETEYGKAKNLARQWLEKQINQGFSATIVRPAMVYGPGDLINLHRLFRAVKTKRFVSIGDGKNTWQWIYIDDLIDGLMLVLHNRKKVLGKVLTLAGERVALKELIGLIAKEEKVSTPKIYLPKVPMLLLGKFFSLVARLGIGVPFAKDTVLTMVSRQRYRTSKALKKLGFKTRIKPAEGVAKAVAWYQERNKL